MGVPMNPNYFFDNVPDAEAPLSAGTFTAYICQDLCISGDSNNTYTAPALDTPHPTYTNEFGKAVVQLQMVELGGMNGVNS
jgi:hypothetical protein